MKRTRITNANSIPLAALLAEARQGTFTGLIIRKKGVVRGKGLQKVTYGDDLVHVVIYTGFRYDKLCKRSLEALKQISDEEILAEVSERGFKGHVSGKDVKIDPAHITQARVELAESLAKSEAGENEATTDHVFNPLTLKGQEVRGARVYQCAAGMVESETGEPVVCHCRSCNPEDIKAPIPGTIYLQGLKIGEVVLEEAKNGPMPEVKSSPVVVAKNLFRKRLPISRYVSYALEKGSDFILSAGGTARVRAKQDGIEFSPDVEKVLDRLMS